MKNYLATTLAIAVTAFSATLPASPVNVNTASAEEISQALNGIGETKAQAIVAQREANGPFKSADDLTVVQGIGPKTIEKNKDDIRL